ncbi:PEP-CTERM-box response regulator transcription factor [Desulfonatronum thioautotrophicum]|uniref:PEP-CTERM-box response regulator transcription factor n=1 Tax=Desulfonatronum thioautotrophicum TaxID=617001 RepID=UPI0005EBB0FA|nr:PEP-CTERM-box response regulator transcription factor [Desulfonatronum thioautotrophicum]
MNKLLIIDDNEDIRQQLKWGLGKSYSLVLAGDVDQALTLFRRHKPAVVTLDLGLPPHEDNSEEGFRCLREILAMEPTTKVIVITGNDDQENALKAIQLGAYDFYRKPVDLDELRIIIKRAFHLASLEEENRQLLHSPLPGMDNSLGIVGQCTKMQDVFATIRKVAESDIAVLITGESGTGKELVARAIHAKSARREGPFVAINCGAIPENLLEAELFGHEKGAFTGAHARSLGKFEYADQGTLFLDEIGELPLSLQVKLLRFLQEKTIQRVGGREDIKVDTRIVSATNIDIQQALEAGSFREDLFYRIGVVSIPLPPLRERGEDILILANLFLRRNNQGQGRTVEGFSPDAHRQLRSYEWPGNVRELENRVQRAAIMAATPLITPEDLGFIEPEVELENLSQFLIGATLREGREYLERSMIRKALKDHAGNIVKTAESLGVARPTLYDMIKKYNLHT